MEEGLTTTPMSQSNTNNHYSILNPLIISIFGIILTTSAIVLYHFLLVKYCMRRHAASTTTTTISTTTTTTPVSKTSGGGVDENILKKIPILTFYALKQRLPHTDQDEECVVCLGELEDDDLVRFLPDCNHAFHVPCIDQWFSAHASCPLCRSPITMELNTTSYVYDLQSGQNGTSSNSIGSGGDNDHSYHDRLSMCNVQPSGLLRHSVSLAFPPMDRRPVKLKRSLSMDQSFVVVTNFPASLSTDNCSSSSDQLERIDNDDANSTRSLSRFDRVSSRLLRSLSRLRLGKGSTSDSPILPY